MLHLGDITKIKGNEAPVVDCVTFGAPCQDLSLAGKRKGMLHESRGDEETSRSGLFHEAIRIIKEMREHDRLSKLHRGSDEPVRPRYAVYENVPGAFSSNKGEDFRVVLEEVARIVEEGVSIPRPEKGKWSNSGVIIGDGWSIAWRVFDAQYWGVPQRRKRICLVADFNGHSAAEIVFNEDKQYRCTNGGDSKSSVGDIGAESRSEVQPICEGLSGDTEQSTEERKEASSYAAGSIGTGHPVFTYQDREGCAGGGKGFLLQEDRSASLRTNNFQTVFQPVVYNGVQVTSPQNVQSQKPGDPCYALTTDSRNYLVQPVETVALEGNGQRPSHMGDGYSVSDKSYTLNSTEVHGVAYAVDMGGCKSDCDIIEDKSPTLCTTHYGEPAVCYKGDGATGGNAAFAIVGDHENRPIDMTNLVVSMDRETFNTGQNFAQTLGIRDDGIQPTLVARGPGAVAYASDGEIAGTLDASYYKGCGMRSGVERTYVVHQDTYQDTVGTLMAKMSAGYCGQDAYNDMLIVGIDKMVRYIVRRLTPLECERLQGYPDGWTDIGDYIDSNGKKRKVADSNRYKALGNSIALPSWRWVLNRMCANYERPATMASLFDGISGFTWLWTQINGRNSVLWTSEIEDFPSEVCKRHFGNEAKGEIGDYEAFL